MVMPTTLERLALVEAGRTWRRGMQAYIVTDRPLESANVSASLLEGMEEFRETFGHFGDIHNGRIWSQPGDARWGYLVQGAGIYMCNGYCSKRLRGDCRPLALSSGRMRFAGWLFCCIGRMRCCQDASLDLGI